MAAEVGQLELAYDYLGEAALMDLDDLEHNTSDGVHIASLAGAWTATVAGFGGMRDHGGTLTFRPRLPEALSRLCFRLCFRGRRLKVEVRPGHAVYSILEGPPLQIAHHGERVIVARSRPAVRPIPQPPARPRPDQPPHRAPTRRDPRRLIGLSSRGGGLRCERMLERSADERRSHHA